MKKAVFLFFAALFISLPAKASAVSEINFPSCQNPTGEVVASYSSGVHGIVGSDGQYSGSDTVYSIGNGNFVQCFCDGKNGIQTNWLKSSGSIEGWTQVLNGENWGLDAGAYLTQNISYDCGGGNDNGGGGNGGGGNGGGGNPSAPTCNDVAPGSAPYIYKIDQGENSATIYWTKATDPVSYYLVAYGTTPGNYSYGNPNVGGKDTTSYTVTGLSGGVTYYFVVRAGNGCKPGPFSNEVSTGVGGGFINGAAFGFLPGVLGEDDKLGEATSSGEVIGVNDGVSCGRCIWIPIIVGEAFLIGLYYLLVRRNEAFKRHFFVTALVGILAYIVFLILNRGGCPDGVIDLKFITIPCRMFWALDGAVYALASLLFAKFHSAK